MGTDRKSLSDQSHGALQPIRPKSPLVLPHPKTGSVQVFHDCLHVVNIVFDMDDPEYTQVTITNVDNKEIMKWDKRSPHLCNALALTCKWLIEHA